MGGDPVFVPWWNELMVLPHHLLLILIAILDLAMALCGHTSLTLYFGLGKCGFTVTSDDATTLRTFLVAVVLQRGFQKEVTVQCQTSSPGQLLHKAMSHTPCCVHRKRWGIDTRLGMSCHIHLCAAACTQH